jgi:lipocalin
MHDLVPSKSKLPSIGESELLRLSRGLYTDLRQLLIERKKQLESVSEAIDLSSLEGQWRVICDLPTSLNRHADNAIFIIDQVAKNQLQLQYVFNDLSRLREVKQYQFHAHFFDMESLFFALVRKKSSQVSVFEKQFCLPYFDEENKILVVSDRSAREMWVLSGRKKLEASVRRDLFIKLESLGFDLQNLRIHNH